MSTLVKIKYSSRRDHSPSLMKAVINYCLQPEKTHINENVFTVNGVNCTPQIAYNEFMANKSVWNKTKGLCFKHYVQSFHPNESITPMQANQIGVEFAEKVWGGYGVLVATHLDRNHIHNHFVIDTVNTETGLKLHETIKNLEKLREINDEICSAHGFSTLAKNETRKAKPISTREYRAGIKVESWKFRLRASIKYSMERCGSREEFISLMNRLGYGVKWTNERKNITYICYRENKYQNGNYKKCRDNKLSEAKYLKENMENEFRIRQEIIAGRVDGETRSDRTRRDSTCSNIRGRVELSNNNVKRHANLSSRYNQETQPTYSRNQRLPLRNTQGIGESDGGHQSCERETNRTLANNPRNHQQSASDRNWERERNIYFCNRQARKERKNILVGSPSSYPSTLTSGIVIGALAGISSLEQGQANKTPEEIEKEERERLAAQNIEAMLDLIDLGVDYLDKQNNEQQIKL